MRTFEEFVFSDSEVKQRQEMDQRQEVDQREEVKQKDKVILLGPLDCPAAKVSSNPSAK